MKTITPQVKKVKELTCHPESVEFYGTEDYDIQELVRSIKKFGMLQPLVVHGNEVQVGNRRLRAAELLKMHEVPVIETDERFTLNKVIGSQVFRIKPPSVILRELKQLDAAMNMRQGRRTDLQNELTLEIEKWRTHLDKTPGAIARYRKINRYGALVLGENKEKWAKFFNNFDAGKFSVTSALDYLRERYLAIQAKKHDDFFIAPDVDYDIYRADSFTMKELDDASVQCIVTQPPPYKGSKKENPILGEEATPTEYAERLSLFMEEARRVLKPEGSLWVVLGDTVIDGGYTLNAHLFAIKMIEKGWKLNDELVWKHYVKEPKIRRRAERGHKYVFHFVLNDDFTYIPENVPSKRSYPGIFVTSAIVTPQVSVGPKKAAAKVQNTKLTDDALNFCEFVPYIPILLTSERGDLVLDMFNGTGTTGLVALAHGRPFVGYEIDKDLNHVAEHLLDECNSKLLKERSEEDNEILSIAS
jgi:DNA modification methylase